MRHKIVVAAAAAAVGVAAMTGTAAAAEGSEVEVCERFGQTEVCVRALETGAVVGVTVCHGIFCIERNVPQPI